ncbi:hypothetical protein EU534_01925 [Candidatus Heimdallarchaeota archaeon]|nr:MAG: hypothetical protein EU534_01925 [Candidatus Heimdallarchaeota archaeon]
MQTNNKDNNLQARAVFLTGMTDLGNELLYFHPNVKINEKIDRCLRLKTMPMACEHGDLMITHISEFQAVCVTRLIPNFEEDSFKKETFATLGLLIPQETNPIPYYKMLKNLLAKLEAEGKLNKETIVESIPKIYTSLNQKINSAKLPTLPKFT